MNSVEIRTLPFASRALELLADPRLAVIQQALGASIQLYVVGGTVRDLFYGAEQKDLDLACALSPDDIRSRLLSAGITAVFTGKQFLTVTAVPQVGQPAVEVSSFRGPNNSPTGEPVLSKSIAEDLRYRDFTINALALSTFDQTLHISDEEALSDLQQKLIRAIGHPAERFAEDPLRIMRMVRFACREGFSLDPKTKQVAANLASLIANVSIERIRDEFSRILISDHPERGLELLVELNLIDFCIPEIRSFLGFEQNRFHRADLFVHTLDVLKSTAPVLPLRLAALLHDVGKPKTLSVDLDTAERHFYRHESVGADMTEAILERLKYPRNLIEQVVLLVRAHMRPIEAGRSGLRRLLRDTGESFALWRELKICDTLACKVDPEQFLERVKQFDREIDHLRQGPELSPLSSLALDGNDLLALGMEEGPQLGLTLRAFHEMVLDNPALNEKHTLINMLKIEPSID